MIPGDAAQALLAWGAERFRDLPWRRTRDPWAIHVSEVMLQQTQVDRVVPRWEQFMARFPTPQVCADAGPAPVIELWDGLGYNRRALHLQRAAVVITETHAGIHPDSLDELLMLPGVGAYTARAILTFAFEHDVGVVDTNVGRVLARFGGRRLSPAEAQQAADASVPVGKGWAWNQGLFDLGAAVCSRRGPSCTDCPLAGWCAWRRELAGGAAAPDPADRSAGVSRGQSTFEGSDRQGRGRLVAALRVQPCSVADVATVMGWPDDPERADRVLAGLVSDGMVAVSNTTVSLPVD